MLLLLLLQLAKKVESRAASAKKMFFFMVRMCVTKMINVKQAETFFVAQQP